MVGGRFSYTGAVLSLIVPEVTLHYWDYQGRVRHTLDENDTVVHSQLEPEIGQEPDYQAALKALG